jgi:hypothetical protein
MQNLEFVRYRVNLSMKILLQGKTSLTTSKNKMRPSMRKLFNQDSVSSIVVTIQVVPTWCTS